MGFFLSECIENNADTLYCLYINKDTLLEFYTDLELKIFISLQHIYFLFSSGISDILFKLTCFIWSTFFISTFSLYFLTCLYFSCKIKKLHFVGFVSFIKFLFTSLILLAVITITSRLLISFEIHELIYYCPKDIYYNIVLFLLVSYSLAINWNLNNLFSIFIRGIFIFILRLSLILTFPSLESFFTLNLFFLLLPGLDYIFQELYQSLDIRIDSLVFMYSPGRNNSGPSTGGNEPGGSNNGGNNGGNNTEISTYLDGDRDDLNDIKDPLDDNGSNSRARISNWVVRWGLSKEDFALDNTIHGSTNRHSQPWAQIICRPFFFPLRDDNLVFLVKIDETVYIVPVLNLRALPQKSNVSITIFKASSIPNLDDISNTAVKYSTGQGLSGELYLTVHSVKRLAYHEGSDSILVRINRDIVEKYDPSCMDHWNKYLFLRKPSDPTYTKLGKSSELVNPKVDKQITSSNFLANSVIFKPYISEMSRAFEIERSKMPASKITFSDEKVKIPC